MFSLLGKQSLGPEISHCSAEVAPGSVYKAPDLKHQGGHLSFPQAAGNIQFG